MFTVTESIILALPPDQVFPVVADPENQMDWDRDGIKDVVKLTSGPIAKGSKFRYTEKYAGTFEVEVDEFEPNSKVSHRFKMKYGEGKHTFTLTAVPEGTKLDQAIEVNIKGFASMFSGTIKTKMTERLHGATVKMKQLMEA